ncbi:hypothetical protein P9747_17240, partial [Paenibacillus macerans]|uniref:hypothetical protein n=1 Tax=Paenibacillus macerans TaxID=44252 RepID=UPI002E1C4CA8|nr:hypothetical protein [Paenibacillus macerans]
PGGPAGGAVENRLLRLKLKFNALRRFQRLRYPGNLKQRREGGPKVSISDCIGIRAPNSITPGRFVFNEFLTVAIAVKSLILLV